MAATNVFEILFLVVLLCISTPILGSYLAKIYGGGKAPGDRVFLPIENLLYRLCGVDPEGEQRWNVYVLCLLAFTAVGILLTYAVLRLQQHLPFNPNHFTNVSPGLTFNTAISFGTNTNWQSYVGESTMSMLSQMFGLVWHQFISAAVGMALAAGFIRSLVRRRQRTIGNFWVDTIRSTLRVIIPITFVFGVIFMSQGVIQNLNANKTVSTVATQAAASGSKATRTQTIPGGPVASMVPIEALGDNGGGYFNANGAHPYEAPNAIVSILTVWLLLAIPFAFAWTYGKMIGSLRQGLVVLTAMVVLFLVGLVVAVGYETSGNPKLAVAGVSQQASSTQAGGNLEGKDLRYGAAEAATDANSITATSTGMTNSAHESYLPLSGGAVLGQIMLGEVDPGGTGTGLYGMLILVILTCFIAGLMVGRTPEYLGKKIQAHDMKLAAIYILVLPLSVLVFSAIAIVSSTASASLFSAGPHGLTEMVYAYTSAAHNNGSAFGGISANTQWFNTTLGLTMLVGRYALIIPAMAIAGSLVRKRTFVPTAGTLRTDTPLFTGMLIGVTVILVGLTYFPVMALGPIVEQLQGHF